MDILYSLYHFLWALCGAAWYGFPSRKLFVAGVTGTKGKSTVLEIMAAIFKTAGHKVAFFDSVRVRIGDEEHPNIYGNSMPGRGILQKFLRDAANAGCTHIFIEVTSQGVVQHRHKFISFDAGVFTNLAPEHIESHSSFENYREAKLSFFRAVADSAKQKKHFVINSEDQNASFFEEVAGSAKNSTIIKFSRNEFVNDSVADTMHEWLQTDFNRENAAAAVAFARALGVGEGIILKTLSGFAGIPGRMEFVQKDPFAVVVDYAHTPESLEAIYKAVKPARERLIVLLGSDGGGRDVWKRPVFGKIAEQYADVIILTSENPHDEAPENIISDIKKGIVNAGSLSSRGLLYEIPDRREAIKRAIEISRTGDVVLMTGKGSEPWLYLEKGKKIPWSDRKVAEEILREK